ncbi:MAG: D-glycero-beta-D-manno-heptose-7-phosphate kinase [Acidobacteriota bacterium]
MSITDDYKNVRVLVIGDVMLDRYWWGTVHRISPEAPVPVVHLREKTYAPGGAANVAANISGLGATAILIGTVGDDDEATLMRSTLTESGVDPSGLVEVPGRPTIVKTRLIAHSQQVVRIDQEDPVELSAENQKAVVDKLTAQIENVDIVVLSDYSKGLLTEELSTMVIRIAGSFHKKVLVDPKGKNYSKYRGAAVVTPNRREAIDAANLEGDHAKTAGLAGAQLLKAFSFGAVLVTLGEDGMELIQSLQDPIRLSAMAKQVYDVTGAGDTVIATLAVALGSGQKLPDAAHIANLAAGIVVEKVGTTPILAHELDAALKHGRS